MRSAWLRRRPRRRWVPASPALSSSWKSSLPAEHTCAPPRRLAAYWAASAARIRDSGRSVPGPASATPQDTDTAVSRSSRRIRSAVAATLPASARLAPAMTTANSSPDMRATHAPGTEAAALTSAWPTRRSARSPAWWPRSSLMVLSSSTSQARSARDCPPSRQAVQRGGQLLVQGTAVGQARQLVLVRQARHAREHLAAGHDAAQLACDGLQEAHVPAGETR